MLRYIRQGKPEKKNNIENIENTTYPRFHSTWNLAIKLYVFLPFLSLRSLQHHVWECWSSFLPPRVTPEHFLHSLLVCAVHCAYNYLNSYFMLELLRSDCESRRKGTAELFWSAADSNITKNSRTAEQKKQERILNCLKTFSSTDPEGPLALVSWILNSNSLNVSEKRELFILLHFPPTLAAMCVHARTQQFLFCASCTWRGSRTCFAYILLILYCPKVFIQ